MRAMTDEDRIALGAAEKQQRDFDDLQNEPSGADTGRIARFLPEAQRGKGSDEKKAKDRAFRDLLDKLLLDPEYRALYEELGTRLRNAEMEADNAIASMRLALAQANKKISEMEAKAGRDPNGQIVFSYADGRVVNADGEDLPPEIAEGIVWPDGAPSAEAYFAVKQRRDDIETRLGELNVYRNDVLGSIRNDYDNRENPMTKDDFEAALQRISNESNRVLSKDVTEPAVVEASPPARVSAMALPPIGQ